MSVQNGERLATKQDLANMYSGILPYLGGMPEMVANKFSKGDLYDTSEKMIGQWHDGKPVYQRVFTGATPVKTPTSRTEYWFYENEMPTNIDTICKIDGYMTLTVSDKYPSDVGTDTTYCPLSIADMENSNFYFATYVYSNLSPNNHRGVRVFARMDSQWFAFSPTVILQYTKTTDSAISIGDETDYSTTENIVGTWIDGSPVWQKVLEGTTASSKNNSSEIPIGCIIDSLVNLSGYIEANRTGWLSFQNIGSDISTMGITDDKSKVSVYIAHDYIISKPIKIIIQYTKATT